ncbi:NnrU family protein [Paracoccus aerius]
MGPAGLEPLAGQHGHAGGDPACRAVPRHVGAGDGLRPWAGAHLVANGDLAHAVFFGGMGVFAVSGLARSGLPKVFRVTWRRILLAVLVWAALLHLHPLLIGVSPLPA